VGYRIDTDPNAATSLQLQRLGIGLAWDSTASTGNYSVFLTSNSSSNGPLAGSTIPGHWPSIIGSAPTYKGVSTTNYSAIGEQVFRFEYCFLLKNYVSANGTQVAGGYSNVPLINNSDYTNTLNATAAPTSSSDNSTGYSTGSRWFDTQSGRGYICTDATAGAAVWQPAGTQDIAAIVVALGILDQGSRKITANMTALAAALPDSLTTNSTTLMKQDWDAAINSATFSQNAQIPLAAAAQVRVYQRHFYLNNQ